MERIEPSAFQGPRAYFTNFDYRIIEQVQNLEMLRRDVERKMKILLLTKSTVTCAASHLTSKFVYQIFKDNPVLLNKGMVVPAMRRDKLAIEELFVGKNVERHEKYDMVAFYEDQILRVVNWSVEDNSKLFRDSFISELENEKSVLRANLHRVSKKKIKAMITEIQRDPLLARDKIGTLIESLNNKQKQVVVNFRELMYHIFGANVINCESTLPQENYIDYSLADMQNRQIILSDLDIFWKIFIELAFETLNKDMIAIEWIDQLSFADIHYLHEPLEKSSFKSKYDKIIKTSISSINKSDNKVLYNINELLLIREDLRESFKDIFQRELQSFLRKKSMTTVKSLGKSSLSIGLGVAGFFPVISTAVNVGSLLIESPAFFVNLWQTFRNRSAVSNYDEYLKQKEVTLRNSINRSHISEKAMMLDAVDLLMKTISERIVP